MPDYPIESLPYGREGYRIEVQQTHGHRSLSWRWVVRRHGVGVASGYCCSRQEAVNAAMREVVNKPMREVR